MENNNIKNIDLWRANKGEKYYFIDYIDNYSYVKEVIYEKYDIRSSEDINRYNSGNYFSSKEIAKGEKEEFKSRKIKKEENYIYWRTKKNGVYFKINNYSIIAKTDYNTFHNEDDYNTGNYFKTFEIGKKVLNSDVWKNRFWDYRKNKKIERSNVYYIIKNDGSIISELDNCFHSVIDYEEGNYFNSQKEAIEFLKIYYFQSIKRIKDFVNNLMKEENYKIKGYNISEILSPYE